MFIVQTCLHNFTRCLHSIIIQPPYWSMTCKADGVNPDLQFVRKQRKYTDEMCSLFSLHSHIWATSGKNRSWCNSHVNSSTLDLVILVYNLTWSFIVCWLFFTWIPIASVNWIRNKYETKSKPSFSHLHL